jgi:hypothetical protein
VATVTQDKGLLEVWKSGVPLGSAWWVFADDRNKERFRELQESETHLGFQNYLEIEIKFRLADGELQAIGIEEGSDVGPILIPEYFFSKTSEVDWYKETVTALGKKFYEVRIREDLDPPEPPDEPSPSELDRASWVVDRREISSQRARLTGNSPTTLETFSEQDEITNQGERQLPVETLPSELEPSVKPRMGRPPSLPRLREVVRPLINGSELNNLSKKEIVTLIRSRARSRFPALFPKLSQPSINKINEALEAEGWPPPPTRENS